MLYLKLMFENIALVSYFVSIWVREGTGGGVIRLRINVGGNPPSALFTRTEQGIQLYFVI
jgi:hypothetical protein